ncbi:MULTISPECIES: hypothetical protein [Methylobacterium]|uniref:hypothetical protein n=1 Tax=Methylobacterium TaxID=407 RepID=UPI0013EBEFE8|nr:hypothetical protein [Methylobacterium sp. DB0501]NGM36212.1 hypothetical protein [Methylobacterium sp. DB0501]
MTMPESHATSPQKRPPVRPQVVQFRPVVGSPVDPVSLFADPIGRVTSPPGDPVPITQTLYRMADGRYVIRTCLQGGGDQACDVMIYADEEALREALSAADIDRALLAAAGLGPDRA